MYMVWLDIEFHHFTVLPVTKHLDVLLNKVFDDTDHVREAVLANPRLSTTARSLHDGVMEGTFVTQRALTKLAKGNSMIRKVIAAHPMCSPKLRKELAVDDDWRIREAVANNEAAELEILEAMGTDPDRDVRGAVARHANTPLAVLEALSADSDHSVRAAVLANPKLVDSQRQACLASAYRRTLISAIGTERVAALLSPLCESRHLNRRSTWQSPHWLERFIAASHPLVADSVLAQLANDAHTAVSQRAIRSIHLREAPTPNPLLLATSATSATSASSETSEMPTTSPTDQTNATLAGKPALPTKSMKPTMPTKSTKSKKPATPKKPGKP